MGIINSFFKSTFFKITVPENLNISNIDVREVFVSETKKNINFINYFKFNLNFLAIKNLKKKNINIIKLIDWWENQPINKSFTKSTKKFHPNCTIISYLGYAPRFLDFHLSPSNLEIKSSFSNIQIHTFGLFAEKFIKENSNSSKFLIAPYFRSKHIWKKIKKKFSKKTIFFCLTHDEYESQIILDSCLKISKDEYFNNYKIVVVCPTRKQSKFHSFYLENNDRINN